MEKAGSPEWGGENWKWLGTEGVGVSMQMGNGVVQEKKLRVVG